MKLLLEIVGLILLSCFILATVFIFYSEPDLWDVWHEMAVQK